MDDNRAKKLLSINVVTFDYKKDIVKHNRLDRAGVIAEDTVDIIPEAVYFENINEEMVPDSVDYNAFVPYLIKMIQLQQKEIQDLKSKIL